MGKRGKPESAQFDLFVPVISDFPIRDQPETMKRPFFSLSKRKRLSPINYVSPDGGIWVEVNSVPRYGMATIWDADVLIWAASVLAELQGRGVNDIPRTLQFHPYLDDAEVASVRSLREWAQGVVRAADGALSGNDMANSSRNGRA